MHLRSLVRIMFLLNSEYPVFCNTRLTFRFQFTYRSRMFLTKLYLHDALSVCGTGFDKIFPPSKDPSPRMSFWDKIRLLYHGRLTMVVQQLKVLLHASLDPYNTTEEMELTWNQFVMDWTNGTSTKRDFLSCNVLVI